MPAPTFLLPLDQLPDPLPIPPIECPFDVTIRPPGSKSITNRALLLAALADGTSTLRGALVDADDAQVMIAALRRLGAAIDVQGDTVKVAGVAGRWKIAPGQTVHLDLHNAGTATRFLAAAAMLAPSGTGIVIDGDARMRERPIEELALALDSLTDPIRCVEYLGNEGFPPVRISPDRADWASGMQHSFGRTQSSQFISALLLIGPFLPYGISIHFTTTDITSRSYIDMTIGLLSRIGADARWSNGELLVAPHRSGQPAAKSPLPAFSLAIEPDASGATYFQGAAAILPGSRMNIDGLQRATGEGTLRGLQSLQGDTHFIRFIKECGATVAHGNGLSIRGEPGLRPLDFNLANMPDTAMTAAVIACFASPTDENPTATTTLRGLRTLRVKETDRLAALQTELTKLGTLVEIFQDGDDEGMRITPPNWIHQGTSVGTPMPPVVFDTYNDHRMAMALALFGLRLPGIKIRNPACVAKTYPTFWRDFAKLYA